MISHRFIDGFRRIALLLFILNLILLGQTPSAPPADSDVDIPTLIAFLTPNSPVLTVGKMSLTWRQVSPIIRKYTASRGKTQQNPDLLKKRIKKLLRSCATRGLLLQEAQDMKLNVSLQDRQQFEASLAKGLQGNDQGLTQKKFIDSFNKHGSTMLNLSYEDALLLMKLDQVMFSDLKLPQELFNNTKLYVKAINDSLRKQNEVRKIACEKILEDPASKTDKGFSNLVREFSEGVESRWGGELKYDFTREELAAVCYLDKFDVKVGENSPVCETNSAYRIVRVLREVPAKDGQEPKLRVAQVLVGKLPLQPDDDESLKATLLKNLRKQKIDETVRKLTTKYPVKCVFFPNGLWTQK